MKAIAKIRDEANGKIIKIGYERVKNEEEKGWRVCASNGDDIGHYRPKTKSECIADIFAMYQHFEDFEII